MLYALGDPVSFVLLVAGLLLAVVLVGWPSSLLAAQRGERTLRAEHRLLPDPRRHLDPIGGVAAALAGVGWARPVPAPWRSSRATLVLVGLAGPALCLAVAAGLLVGAGLVAGSPLVAAPSAVLRHGVPGGVLPAGARVLLLLGVVLLSVGLLSLVPLPPLPGGTLLLALVPPTPFWRSAQLYLVEKNLGTLAVLVLLLLPLGGGAPLLLVLLDAVGGPVLTAATGG